MNYADTLEYLPDDIKQKLKPFHAEINKKLADINIPQEWILKTGYPKIQIYNLYCSEIHLNTDVEIVVLTGIDDTMCRFIIRKLYGVKLSSDINMICKMVLINPHIIKKCVEYYIRYKIFEDIRSLVRYIINNLSESKIHMSYLACVLVVLLNTMRIDHKTDYKIYKLMNSYLDPQTSKFNLVWDPFNKYPNRDVRDTIRKRYNMCHYYIAIIHLFGKYNIGSPIYRISRSSIYDKNVFRLIVRLSIKLN